LKIGSILGSILFPPAALLGLVDLGGNNHPCVQYAKDTEGQAAPTPSTPLDSGRSDQRQQSVPNISNETER
jgi:hypothetical protein